MAKKYLVLVLLSVLFSAAGVEAGVFRAAAGQVDITPPPGAYMWGYSDRAGPAQGVLDPLFSRVLVLDDGTSRVALVTLDLGRTFAHFQINRLKEEVRRSSAIQEVFFFASHTHSGPVIEDSYPGGNPPAWETAALKKITSALADAAGRLQPARIGTGIGETFVGHNRRLLQPDGKVKMFWRNETKVPTSPVDPWVGVIRVDDIQGRPLAILVNYSCHPVVLGPDNLQYSAEFPGAMAELVERELEGNPVCMFVQGAPGDINPYYDKTPLVQDAVRLMRETGIQLGREVCRVSRGIATRVPEKPSLDHSLDLLQFEVRWDIDRLLAHLDTLSPQAAGRYRDMFSRPLQIPVMTLLVNKEIAFMGMPGEPFVDFAIDFRTRSPVPFSFFAGYANGFYAYFPTMEAAVTGGYGANSLTTFTEVGAGEAMVDHSIIAIYRMLGALKPVPSQ
jgi:neutral ceramidase